VHLPDRSHLPSTQIFFLHVLAKVVDDSHDFGLFFFLSCHYQIDDFFLIKEVNKYCTLKHTHYILLHIEIIFKHSLFIGTIISFMSFGMT
jgi:hypothetical protein